MSIDTSLEKRPGDWFQTAHGHQLWPLDPRPEEIDLDDIATALANLCRFNGHVQEFYSVAQHSCLVHDHAPAELRAAALLHDATEGLGLGDMIRPLKKHSELGRQYMTIELAWSHAVEQRFGLVGLLVPLHPIIHELDARALMTEKRDLLSASRHKWSETAAPFAQEIMPWPPVMARKKFMQRARTIGLAR